LTACSFREDKYSDLEQPPSLSMKDVPGTFPDYTFDGFEKDALRCVGASSDTDIFLAQNDKSGVCVLVHASEYDRVSCRTEAGGKYQQGEGVTLTTWPDDATTTDSLVPPSENGFVRTKRS
jgi:hypothetical protein